MKGWAKFSFFLVAVLWGTSFAFQKTLLVHISPVTFTFWNFALAWIVLCGIVLYRKLDIFYRWREGLVLGALLAALELFQMLGLAHTSSAHTVFISNLGMLLVPYFGWLLFKHRVSFRHTISLALAIIGMYFLVGGITGIGYGEIFLIISAIAMSLYFVYSERFEGEHQSHISVLLFQQFLVTSLISGSAVLFSGNTFSLPTNLLGDFLWQVVAFTIIPFMLIQWASRFANEMIAAVYDGIAEPLIGGLTSWVIFAEPATHANVFGAFLMITAFSFGSVFSRKHFLFRKHLS